MAGHCRGVRLASWSFDLTDFLFHFSQFVHCFLVLCNNRNISKKRVKVFTLYIHFEHTFSVSINLWIDISFMSWLLSNSRLKTLADYIIRKHFITTMLYTYVWLCLHLNRKVEKFEKLVRIMPYNNDYNYHDYDLLSRWWFRHRTVTKRNIKSQDCYDVVKLYLVSNGYAVKLRFRRVIQGQSVMVL